jgi:SSS family transporter
MSSLDWIVMGGTILAIVVYGIWKSRGSQDLRGYFLANNSMKWWTIGLSVMATQASAITFLSTPGQAYDDGMRFIQFYFGLPIAIVIIAAVIIPLYRRAQIFTAYEYLERRFDGKTRTLGALLFLISRSIASGLTIYAPAIIMSSLLGWNIYLTCLVIGLVVILYTTLGGTKAVSVTQKWQMAVILLGMFAAGWFMLNNMPNGMGFSETLFAAGKMGKLNVLTMPDSIQGFFSDKYNLLSGLIGGSFLALSYFGTDQSQVQRYLGGRSVSQMRIGLIFNAIFKIPLQFAILFIGAMMFVYLSMEQTPFFFNKNVQEKVEQGALGEGVTGYYNDFQAVTEARKAKMGELMALYPNGDPTLIEYRAEEARSIDSYAKTLKKEGKALATQDASVDNNDLDYGFLYFITKHLPSGLIGLLLAMVLSASMSSTSAELNALASTSVNDFYKRNRTDINDTKQVQVSKTMTVVWGLLAIAFSVIFSQFENLIEAVNFLGSIFYGPILGLFLAAFFIKGAKPGAVFLGGLVAQAIVLALALFGEQMFGFEINYLWFNVVGALIVVFFALLGGSRKVAEDLLPEMSAQAGDFRAQPEREEPLAVVDAAPQLQTETVEEVVDEIEEIIPPAIVKKRTEDVDKLAARMEDLSEEEKKFIMATRLRLKGMVPDMVKAMRRYTPLRDASLWVDGEKETYLFDFEVDPKDYRINMYPSADDATRLGKEPILQDEWPILAEGIHQMYPEDNQSYHAYRALQDKVFADWFAFCWHQAGGRISYFPAYLTFTDSDQAFNLKRKTWERK